MFPARLWVLAWGLLLPLAWPSLLGARALPAPGALPGRRAAPADLASTLSPVRAAAGLPALAAAVFRGERLLALGAVGVGRRGGATAVTSVSRWHLGSDTKAMTATLAGLYVDRAWVRLDDQLATLFPGEDVHPGYAAVTLEQLLQHRGGAPADVPPDIWAQMWADGAAPEARHAAVRALLARGPTQTPGTYVYSNSGYVIVGAALERAAGARWEELMRRDLFRPLRMASCGFGAPGAADPADAPWGHRASGEPVAPGPQADNPPALGPAGAVHCSLLDWGRLLAVHLAGARGERTILAPATVRRLQTPPLGGHYAAGWIVGTRSWAAGPALAHSGSNTLWSVTVWLAPARNLAFAVVTNQGGDAAAQALDRVIDSLIRRYAN